MKYFSRYLDKYMEEHSLSVNEVAAKVEVSPYTVNKWLKDDQLPLPRQVFSVARMFDITTTEVAILVYDGVDYASQLAYMLDLIAYSYGKSRTEFAQIIDIHHATLARWKSEMTLPREENVSQLYRVFKWHPSYIEHLALNPKCGQVNLDVVMSGVGALHVYATGKIGRVS